VQDAVGLEPEEVITVRGIFDLEAAIVSGRLFRFEDCSRLEVDRGDGYIARRLPVGSANPALDGDPVHGRRRFIRAENSRREEDDRGKGSGPKRPPSMSGTADRACRDLQADVHAGIVHAA
jgi:hypothetical protein